MSVTRVRPAGVVPLEVWDLLVEGRSLHEWQDTPEFARRLVDGLALLQRGEGRFLMGAPPRRQPRVVFDRVFVTGGRLLSPGLEGALDAAGLVFERDSDPAWPGLAGAEALSGTEALGVDLGQTALKVWWRGSRVRRERDRTVLPLDSELTPAARRAGRSALVTYFGDAVRAIDAPPSAPVVLALPTQISDEGGVSGCSYPYPDPDPSLLPDLLAAADLIGRRVQVLNDAELAACSARAKLGPRARGVRTLVLTLGFGVGAALLAG